MLFERLNTMTEYRRVDKGISLKELKSMLSDFRNNMKDGYDIEGYFTIEYKDGTILNTQDVESYKEIKLNNIVDMIISSDFILADTNYKYQSISDIEIEETYNLRLE
jgi:hypothetical protein